VSRPPSLSFGEFARELREMRKTAPISRLLEMLPGPVAALAKDLDESRINEEFDNVDLVAAVMTSAELLDPTFVPDDTRTREIATRAEVPLQETALLFRQIEAARRFLAGEDPSTS
jgi:signal recognition particle GTPase